MLQHVSYFLDSFLFLNSFCHTLVWSHPCLFVCVGGRGHMLSTALLCGVPLGGSGRLNSGHQACTSSTFTELGGEGGSSMDKAWCVEVLCEPRQLSQGSKKHKCPLCACWLL